MIGKKIKALRKQSGLTQIELASMIKTSNQLVSRWELGEINPCIESLKKIAGALGVSVSTLIE